MSRITLLLVAVATLAFAPHASASKTFPEALRKKLELDQLPYGPLGCKLCHQDDVGGLMTATKPFGRAVLQDGATATNVPSLLAALDRLEAATTDSDGDGVSDLDELQMEQDPNVAMAVDGKPVKPVKEIPLPETGCSIVSTGPRVDGLALFVATLGALILRAWPRKKR